MKKISWNKIMTISVICIIGTIACISAKGTITNKTTDNIVNESPYNELFPENIRSTILTTDSLIWFLVDPWIDNDSVSIACGEDLGEVLCSKTTGSISLNDGIRELLLSPKSFKNDSIAKESTFMPDFRIIFINSSDTVIVSYSLYCDICRFQSSEGIFDLNGENIRKSLILTLKTVFPKDKFVRNISRRL